MLKTGRVMTIVLLSLCAFVIERAATAADAGTDSEWRLLGGNADAWHYSALKGIDDHNIQRLGLAWVADIPSKDGRAGNPLVAEGVVYQSGPLGRIYANDLRTGKLLWRFAPQVKF